MSNRTALGEFLQSRRARITPRQAGLPPSAGRRRTAGLRREEVAILAGISIEYYRRLEQGKQRHPGPAVLAAIADVLELNEDERRHLTALVENDRPNESPVPVQPVRADVRRMLDIVHPYPACLLGRRSDLLGANIAGLRLFPGIEEWPAEFRNTARYTFMHPKARAAYGNWDDVAAGVVAHLHAVAGTHPGAADIAELIDELSGRSPEFTALWQRHDVRNRTNGQKIYRHPDVGEMTLTYEAYEVGRSDGQRLIVYQAEPGTPDHEAMLRLSLE
ncbi:helix-turn-helix transcriptional regulator [Nocardia arthritidis]|uniref:Helix-turn-helix domain-containing protein n=1 Tax=Nocardia arthritidis TaxID=228602 RepID=A0A6G9Y9Y8_9NOCA|nr:helix-turn-helix transcriptional regulator [Nocardia arthritidis]QIS10085.1 helix-turn-helix domain-containing protein [Nocardia arthritidis]